MSKLPYAFYLHYLTEVAAKWRPLDFNSRVIVKGLKQEPFNGYLEAKVGGKTRRFDQTNVEELVKIILPQIGRKLRESIEGPISIVPVPNSGMAVGAKGPFRTVELASFVAAGCGDDATVCQAIRWDAPRNKAHQNAEFRHPGLYEPHMVFDEKPTGRVVLFDDVLTSGSQMIAAARTLAKFGFEAERAIVVARATTAQENKKLWKYREDELDLADDPFDFDDDNF